MNFNLRSVYELVQSRELSVAGAEKLISDFTRESGLGLKISEARTDSPEMAGRQAIAITGIAGRFPDAPDADTFWSNLAAGRSAGIEAPLSRWGVEQESGLGKLTGCFLANVDEFDPLFFGLSGKDAEFADPQQRLFLQEAWKALEDAGYSDRTLNNSRCGVFVGVGPSDYTHRMISEGVAPDPRAFVGNASSILASRISYILNLKGPSIAVDTACSSSLVAVHLACQSILTHESDLALAGGVFISTSPGFHVLTSMAGMLSPDGKCKAFDDSADGFVPGEAVAAVVLKRLDNALADGDHIYGVIIGSGVNQDGKTNGITAPSSISQSELECAVYDRSGIDPATLTYVETHGTGTKLGDPVEFEALTNAFRRYTDKQQYCAIGSVKTNIGHCSTAAGITGLIKVLLSLKHRQLPPSLNFERPNALIRFEGSPFYVNTRLCNWEPNGHSSRRAAVSSFGLSGTNAHLIVEQAPARADHAAPAVPYHIVTISAKTQEAFHMRVRELRQFLDSHSDEDFADICYTLNAGRSHFTYRAAIIARDRHDLLSKLDALERDGRADGCIIRLRQDTDEPDDQRLGALESLIGTLRSNSSASENEYRDLLVALADYYVNLYAIDWDALYAGQQRRRVSLPTYPFSRERYWLSQAEKPVPAKPVRKQRTSGPYYYSRHWENKPLKPDTQVSLTLPHIIVFEQGSEIANELEREISEAALRTSTIVVRPGKEYRQDPATRTYTVNPTSRSDYEALLASLERRGVSNLSIVHCWRLNHLPEAQESERALDLGVRSIAALAQAALSRKSPATVIFLSRGVADDSLPYDAAVAGFSSSLPMLNPALRVMTVCLDAHTEISQTAGVILSELRFNTSPGLDEIRYTATDRFVRATLPLNTESALSHLPIRSAGTYLITGGCGALGSIFARYLARRYAGKIILTGRKESDTTRVLVSEIARFGGEALFVSADVGDEQRMREVIVTAKARYGRLDGVIHAAGGLDGKPLNTKNLADFNAVLSPKIRGTMILDSLTRDEDLAFFAVFSSVSSVLGDFGQCDYAVASRFLDAFAAERERLRAAGARTGKTVSIGWPLWEAGQTHFADGGDRLYLKATGLEYLTQAKGTKAFEYALSSREPQVLVLDGDRERIEKLLYTRNSPIRVASAKETVADTAAPAATSHLPAHTNSQPIEIRLREIFSEALRIDSIRLDGDMNFSEFGVDSIAVKDLTDRLNREFNLDLTPTVLFANSTLAKLSRHLSEHCCLPVAPDTAVNRDGEEARPVTLASVPEQNRTADRGNKLVAIIGASARLPQSHNLDEFWQHLVEEKDLITEVPRDRWNWQDINRKEGPQPGKSVPHWGGFMDDIDKFDAAFFHISPREAAFMDPQHRLVLETAWKAFEDAGYRPSSLAGRRVGVFVGAQFNEYMALIGDAGEARAQAALGSTHTMLANRVSYFLDFRGPSEVIDTACSSALIAIHRAVRSIQTGECELALAGGVSLMLSRDTVELANELGMLAPDGRCKAFDRRANGYVKGEGVGALLLKPLDRAIADGDHVYAVIRGSAENHGGRANSLTAPNPDAQTDLLIDAYKNAGIDPGEVTYIEAHGTGTELGDPIEIGALAEAFRRLRQDNGREPLSSGTCGIGSVKTNVGHLEPAAGIAGVMKVLLALRHRTLPATLHVEEVNPYIRLESTPFYLVTKTTAWNFSRARIAGVSSFGFGGSNAHVILEEYVDGQRQATAAVPEDHQLILLSAKDEDRLREQSRALLSWVTATVESRDQIRLEDVAFTLQVGREPMEERLAIVTSSFDDLVRKLDAFLDAKQTAGIFRGSVKPRHGGFSLLDDSPEAAEFIRATLVNRRLDRLAGFWTGGMDIDWSMLYPDRSRRRLSLPTYPFARQRHWVEPQISVGMSADIAATSRRATGGADSQSAAPRLVGPSASSEPIKNKLRSMLAAALYMESSVIDDSMSFSELGLDSILAVELVDQLNNEFGTKFKATRLYDYSNLNELSTFLSKALEENGSDVTQQPSQPGFPPGSTVKAAPTPTTTALKEIFASVLGLTTEDIDETAPFSDLGVDFVVAAEAIQAINERFRINLASAKLYDFSNIAELALYLDSSSTMLSPAPTQATGPELAAASPLPQRATLDSRVESELPTNAGTDGIAIIGMSGRFPNAHNVDEFWQNLARGHDSVTEVPKSRWDTSKHFNSDPTVPGTMYSKWCACLEDIDKFDPLFFNIPPRDAEIMEPQQRIFLEEAWHTFEDAGYSSEALNDARCAVFAGVGQGDYYLNFPASDTVLSAQMGMGNVPSILAARIAYLLNLKGAAIPIDTACSSSLVAIHLGCQSLLNRESDLALAGGVCVLTTSRMHIITSQARMLSPEGKCKAFDNTADGFVPGEAVGLVLLKRLSDAIRDGDHIYGVVRGSGMNQDGRTNGITAPSTISQTALELSVYERSGISPDTITQVEAHGTGTKLGDPIEIEALTNAFRKHTSRSQYCAISTVKTNIGHTLFAAGIAGVIKVLLSLKHRQIPPSLHFGKPNEQIDFENTPFFVNTSLRSWDCPTGAPLRAAISSFGWSGTNAHLIIEEAPALASTSEPEGRPYYLANVSAKTPAALEARLRDLLQWLEGEGANQRIEDISFTLNWGRTHFSVRSAFICKNHAELAASIEQFLASGDPPSKGKKPETSKPQHDIAELLLGNLSRDETDDPAAYREGLLSLAQYYTNGCDLDWSRLYRRRRKRISLPGYPFARRTCWVAQSAETVADAGRTRALHPLLDRYLPSLNGALFEKTFHNSEPVVSGHVVRQRAILPGVAYLEMARAAAAAMALPGDITGLKNVVWRTPLEVAQEPVLSSVLLKSKGDDVQFSITSKQYKEEIHCTGEVELGTVSEQPVHLDIPAILSRCKRRISGADLYREFESRGIQYGPQFRGLESIHAGAGESLGTIRITDDAFRDAQWKLHPGILDSALQSTVGLLQDSSNGASGSGTVMLPFSVGELRLISELPEMMYAYATHAAGVSSPGSYKFNILLADERGRVCLEIREFAIRAIDRLQIPVKSQSELTMLRPVWTRTASIRESTAPAGNTSALILRSPFDFGITSQIRRLCPEVQTYEVLLGANFRTLSERCWEIDHRNQEDFDRVLAEVGPASSIYFLGGLNRHETLDLADVERSQQLGVFSLFRLVKALTGSEGMRLPAVLKVVTNDLNPIVPDDRPYPHAGSLVGFTKVLALEYPRLHSVVIDLRGSELGIDGSESQERLLRAVIAEEGAHPVPEIAYRNGRRYSRKLELVDLAVAIPGETPIRTRGVYAIAGGIGGIGFTLAHWLASQYRARIALLGRSPLDDRKRQQIRDIEAVGGEAIYCQADLTDLDAVKTAIETTRNRWGAIHGAIHSSVVLKDSTIQSMDESGLQAVLAPKVTGSVALVKALSGPKSEPPDFLAFFSSSISFTGGPGQANYAAASTFEDALAASLACQKQLKTLTINWGYWGEVGVVASTKYRERATSLGIGSIEGIEGMDAFQRALSSSLLQVAVLKISTPVLEKLGVDVTHRSVRTAAVFGSVAAEVSRTAARYAAQHRLDVGTAAEEFAFIEHYARQRLFDWFQTHAPLDTVGTAYAISELSARIPVAPKKRSLFTAFLNVMARSGFIQIERERGHIVATGATRGAEHSAEAIGEKLSRFPEIRPMIDLIDGCVARYDDVLSGASSGTSVLFPKGSPSLAEAVYSGNRFADFYNNLVANCVRTAMRAAVEQNAGTRIRLLEVGAGTGGTSIRVLEAICEIRAEFEYCYSDISPALLRYGHEKFGPIYPFLTFHTLDIERDPELQQFDTASVDIVIASNVLHATRHVSCALENVKRLLKRNGLLILNETNFVSDFSIMTFGLTDGWWLFEDGDMRQPDSPFLSNGQWTQVLAENGFRNVSTLGGENHAAGQSVFVCESDGWTTHKSSSEKIVAISKTKTAGPEVNGVAGPTLVYQQQQTSGLQPVDTNSPEDSTDLAEVARAYLVKVFVELLKLQESEVDDNATFDTYGIDSLVGLEIVNRLEADLGTLTPTMMFEYSSLGALAGYLAQTKSIELERVAPRVRRVQPSSGHAMESIAPYPLLIPVRVSAERPATFWIHGLLGETNWVVRLAKYLGPQFSVYGLQASGIDGKAPPHSNVEEMAEAYVKAIRTAQPEGPYIFGGYSSGGTVAFEMAQRLRKRGEAVSHLFLLDSYAPGSAMIESLFHTSDETWLLLAIGNLFSLQWKAEKLLELSDFSGLDSKRRLEVVAEHLRLYCPQYASAFQDLPGLLRNLLGVAKASGDAFQSYAPEPYSGDLKVTLFRCEDGLIGEANALHLPKLGSGHYEADNGWARWLSSPPSIISLPGDHFSVGLEPGVQIVAEAITKILSHHVQAPALAANGGL